VRAERGVEGACNAIEGTFSLRREPRSV